MKQYKNYIIVAASLLIIYLLLVIPPIFSKKDLPKLMFPTLNSDIITKIVIEHPNKEKVDIVKKESDWEIEINKNYYEIDPGKQEGVLKLITDLTSDRKVTKNMKELSTYSLTDTTAHKINVYVKDELFATILVGKSARDFRSTFFKLDQEKVVRLSSETLISKIRGNSKNWMDHKIFEVNSADVEEIKLPQVHLIKKKDTRWYYADSDKIKVDEQKVTGYLNIFSAFRTNDFELEKNEKECGLEKGEPIITLKTIDGISYNIIRGNEDKKNTYIKAFINGKPLPLIYKFTTNRVKGLIKKPEHFILEQLDSTDVDVRIKKRKKPNK